MSKFDDYKKILGLKDNFTEADLKKAYFKLAKKYHPDKNKRTDTTEKFKEINIAYSYLKDYIAGKSSNYDEEIEEEYYQEEYNSNEQENSYSQESNENDSNEFEDFTYKYYNYQQQNPQTSSKTGCIVFLIIIIIIFSVFISQKSNNTYNEPENLTPSQATNYETDYESPSPSSNYNIPVPKSNIPQIAQPTAPVTPAPSFGGSGRFDSTSSNSNGAPGIDDINKTDNSNNALAQGVDFGPYIAELQRRVKMNWDPPRGNKSQGVVLLLKIARDGQLMGVQVSESSGIPAFDNAAINAVKLTAPFRPLPSGFKGNSIDIQFTLNLNVRQADSNYN